MGWCGDSSGPDIPIMDRINRCRAKLARWKRENNSNSATKIKGLQLSLEEEIRK